MVLRAPLITPKMSSRGNCIHGMFEYCGTGPTFFHSQLVCGQSQSELLCRVTEPQTKKMIPIAQHLNPPSSTPINHWLPFWQQEQVGRFIPESHSLVHLEESFPIAPCHRAGTYTYNSVRPLIYTLAQRCSKPHTFNIRSHSNNQTYKQRSPLSVEPVATAAAFTKDSGPLIEL